MKVYINKYKNHWISPYTICEKVCFWREIDYDEPWVKRTNTILEPIMTAVMNVWSFFDRKIDYVKIDRWDTWSMDNTLALIVLPMLKQLKATKHGYALVKDEDAPEELSSDKAPKHEDYEWDDNAEARWDYVLNEMIFAFEHIVDESWQEEFRSGEIDWDFVSCEDNANLKRMVHGPNHTYKCDYDGMKKVEERIQKGLELFGKYYRNLWD